MDTKAECTHLHRNPKEFQGPKVPTDGYGGHSVRVKAVQLSLDTMCVLRHEDTVYVCAIPVYILGIDVL